MLPMRPFARSLLASLANGDVSTYLSVGKVGCGQATTSDSDCLCPKIQNACDGWEIYASRSKDILDDGSSRV